MTRHGKLSGSPFHVENMFYKYAIEHESEDCKFPVQKPNCQFHVLKGNVCGLCNSGYQTCTPHKCKYYQVSLRRKATCSQCAYHFHGRCAHGKCRKTENIQTAEYCCYFNGDPLLTRKVQKQLSIVSLQKQIEKAELAIKRSRKYIKEAEREISLSRTREEDRVYLKNKIIVRQKRIQEFEQQLVVLNSKLKQMQKR